MADVTAATPLIDTSTVVGVLLLLAPGCAALELSNSLSIHQSLKRGDQEKLAGIVLFGFISLSVYSLYYKWGYGQTFGQTLLWLTKMENLDVGRLFGLLATGAAIGAVWASLKNGLIRRFYHDVWRPFWNKRGQGAHLGHVPVWNLLVEKNFPGNLLQVLTDDGVTWTGVYEYASDIEAERELVLKNVSWTGANKIGKLEPFLAPPQQNTSLVYLPVSRIRYIGIHGLQPAPQAPPPPLPEVSNTEVKPQVPPEQKVEVTLKPAVADVPLASPAQAAPPPPVAAPPEVAAAPPPVAPPPVPEPPAPPPESGKT